MKVSLIIVAALASAFMLRNQSAALRHWLLAAAMALAAAMPLLELAVPSWNVSFATEALGDRRAPPQARSVSIEEQVSLAAGQPAPPAPRGKGSVDLLRAVWLTGTMLSLAVLAVGLGRLAWLASRARRVSDERWAELLGPVPLLQSDHPTLLVTWGLAPPRIILPLAARGWSNERMRIVLWHELAHIRRGDWIVQMMAEVLRAVYWFNPLLWIACRRLRLESEQACDDAVMNGGIEGPEYATELLGLARDLKQRRTWLPAPAMARPSSLERRIRAMLNTHVNRGPLTGFARLTIAAGLLAIAIPIAAAQSAFATFSGSIVDAQGLSLPNATVVLSNEPRQSKYEVKSDQSGNFEFVGLPAADYTLEIRARGFATLHQQVPVSGRNLQRRYALQIGSVEESITVTAGGDSRPPSIRQRGAFKPEVETDCMRSAVGGNITPPKKIRDVAPLYPASFRGADGEGIVVLDTTIGLDGFVNHINVREGADPDLADAAITAVRQWQFTQTLLNCTPVEVSMKVTTRFKHRQ
jgi:beta-lactamase regulating signal transducer with metallopeptidase domain